MYKDNSVHSPNRDDVSKRFEEMVISAADRIKPMLGEQMLREYILGMGDTTEILNTYSRAFEVDAATEVRVIVFKPFDASDFDDFFFIKNTAQQYIGTENLLLSMVVNDFLLMITTIPDKEELAGLLDKVRMSAKSCYDYNIMAIYSKTVSLSDTPSAYERLKNCMGYSFYADSDRTLYEEDVRINSGDITLRPEYSAIEHAVRGGDSEKTKILVSAFFKKLRKAVPTPVVAKTYCLELYVCIIRCCGVEKIERYMKGIMYIQEAKTLSDIQEFIEEKGAEITAYNAPESRKIYSSLIRDTIDIIDENIENENLSLRWLAGTILYTNVDYLGKLFKKETGKNFSHYVMEKRMEMAKELILEGRMDRIYEVAENVGYGSNSQYFSQVFKKYTGVSPLEYKEFARLTREKNKLAQNS